MKKLTKSQNKLWDRLCGEEFFSEVNEVTQRFFAKSIEELISKPTLWEDLQKKSAEFGKDSVKKIYWSKTK